MTELARWCFRHRFTVVTIWVATLVAIAVPYLMLGASYNDAFNLPGMESTKAQSLLQATVPAQAGDSDQIVVHARHGSVRDPAVKHRVTAMLAEVAALPSVASVQSMYTPAGAAQISQDRATAFATVTFDAQADKVPVADTTRVIRTAQAAADANLQIGLGGESGHHATGTSTPSTEYIGILAAAIILFVAFGTLLGMIVPLLVAIAGVGAGMITDRPALPGDHHRHGRPDRRRPDRPRRRHRLRPVHRHPPPRRPAERAAPAGRRRAGPEHLRTGGPVRRRHGDASRCSACSSCGSPL